MTAWSPYILACVIIVGAVALTGGLIGIGFAWLAEQDTWTSVMSGIVLAALAGLGLVVIITRKILAEEEDAARCD
jgi:hypothetical protein